MVIFTISCLIFVIMLLIWSAHRIASQKNDLVRTLAMYQQQTLDLFTQQARENQALLAARTPAEFQAYQAIPFDSPAGYVSYDTSDGSEEAAPAEVMFDITPDEMIEQIAQEYDEHHN